MNAKYAGKCAKTGQSYPAGTAIVKGQDGWEISPCAHFPDVRHVRLQPLAAEFGCTSPASSMNRMDLNKPLFCSCARTLPGFDEKDPATYAPSQYRVEGDHLTCPQCGRTGEILGDAEVKKLFPLETRTCWECGCTFTYAECRRNGGDWNENGGYCGC